MTSEEKKKKKEHVSIVVCGHVDAGKSTTTGRLIFELGGIQPREMEKLRQEASTLGKDSFAFAFYLDTTKEERQRGVTITPTTKEFFTENYHYSIVDAPGHRDFIKNMISGASQADVALLLVPADGNFTTSIARGNHKMGEIQGQTRQHARLLNLLGVKQLIVAVNKMDTDLKGKYSKDRFLEIKDEMASMLVKVGWKKPFVDKCVPILPISGFLGDNLITKSTNMPWWEGAQVSLRPKDDPMVVITLLDALNNFVKIPERDATKPLRMPVSNIYKIKGVGDVIAGRLEQGVVKPKDMVRFIPSKAEGSVFSIEMHHVLHPVASPGDNVGLNIKGLVKEQMPRAGDCMILQKDTSLKRCKSFIAQVQVLDHPGELKKNYTPIVCVRTAKAACKITEIIWKIGKDSAGAKIDNSLLLKSNEMAELKFEPTTDFVCDEFNRCEGMGRVAVLEGSTIVMLGKIVKVEFVD